MQAKSFLARDAHQRLIGARTALTQPEGRFTCHLCRSTLTLQPEPSSGRAWFAHPVDSSVECPYVGVAAEEIALIDSLRCYTPGVLPVVLKRDWYCAECGDDYHGERYCLLCRTGRFSTKANESSLPGDYDERYYRKCGA